MYNRYSPQPDGSYRKNTLQDASPPPSKQENFSPPPKPADSSPLPQYSTPPPKIGNNIPSFLRRLLPKDMDTGDLFIILLLLLMAGDSQENKTNSILTLALYFLM